MSELQVTQCPYCKTHFRLSQEQLSAAAGNVRCGACLKVFNALDNSDTKAPATSTPAERHNAAGELLIHDDLELDDLDLEALGLDESIVEEVNPPLSASREPEQPRATVGTQQPQAPEQREPEQQISPIVPDQSPLPEHDTTVGEPHSSDDSGLDLHDDFLAIAPAPALQAQKTSHPPAEPESQTHKAAQDTTPAKARLLPLQDETVPGGIFMRGKPAGTAVEKNDQARPESGLSAEPLPAEPSDTEEQHQTTGSKARSEPSLDGNLTLPELEDEPLLLDEVGYPPRRRRSWIWTPLCLLAVVALVAQAVTYNFDAWARDARLRPMLESICLLAGCELPVRVDISLVRSSNLLVRPHPEFPNAVAIDVIIYNRADYPQPFPVVRMTFSDNRGDSVSEKRFRPEEYLGGELAGRNLMPPQTPIHIALSMVAPGPKATSYNLDFLSP